MALANYRLALPSTVILADERDPHVSWRHHLERAGRGGIDIVAAKGTPVYARTSGTMRRIPNNGGAGNSCEFWHDDNPGWRDVFSHLTGYVGVDGQRFDAGQVVAYTGITGGVAPHLHWHLLDPKGVRRNPWDYFTPVRANVHIVETITKEIIAMADFGIQAVEQRGTVNGPNYQRIAIYGPGLWRVIETPQRDTYNALRIVTAKASKEMGGDFLLPKDATEVDAVGWDAIERVFNPDYGQ